MDAVPLSRKTAKSLAELESVSTENLGKICKYILQTLIKGSSSVKIDSNLDDVLAAVATLLLEAAKADASTEQVKAVLTEQGVEGETAAVLLELYETHKETITGHIMRTDIPTPTLIGVDWRLDYAIRSKHAGRINAPVYLLALRLRDRGLLRNVEMTASLEQLQDMLSKVRDAVKQVDRVVNMSDV